MGRKVRVNVEDLLMKRSKIDSYDSQISKSVIDEWKFTGLTNTSFVEVGAYDGE